MNQVEIVVWDNKAAPWPSGNEAFHRLRKFGFTPTTIARYKHVYRRMSKRGLRRHLEGLKN